MSVDDILNAFIPEFIPHGAECSANHRLGEDFGRCGERASAYIVHAGIDRLVCEFHRLNYVPDLPTPEAR